MNLRRLALCNSLAMLACLHLDARAQCSRDIIVPAAPTGVSIRVNGSSVTGLIPDILNQIGPRIGCTFRWSIVPRIRLETMFETGSADLLVASTHLERRDKHGIFIPIVETRPTLISVDHARPAIRSMAELATRRELRVALVRGYDYGADYQAMVATLSAQGRVYMEPDVKSVARLLAASMADVTIMPASSLIGAVEGDARVEGLAGKLRIEPLSELPWIKTGIYISRNSLPAADRALLEQALQASVKSGIWWQTLKKYYPPSVLQGSTRPVDGAHAASVR